MAEIIVDWTQLGIIMGFVTIAGGIVATYFKGVIKSNKDLNALEIKQNERHAETCKQLAAIDVKVSVFWTYLESNLPNILKRPIHKQMDQLLDKFKLKIITRAELIELKPLVQALLKEDMITNKEMVLGDVLMLGLIDVRLLEVTS